MKKLITFGLMALSLLAQEPNAASNSPDCYFKEIVATNIRTASFDNRMLKCNVWKLQVINLSNATADYEYASSPNGTTWHKIGRTTVATVAASTIITFSNSDNYLSVLLYNKGTGNFIVTLSGYYSGSPVRKNSPNFGGPESVGYTLLRDVASATVTYVGIAKSIFDPVTNVSYAIFAIQKITSASDEVTSVQNADGDTEEDNIWANRASLTYK